MASLFERNSRFIDNIAQDSGRDFRAKRSVSPRKPAPLGNLFGSGEGRAREPFAEAGSGRDQSRASRDSSRGPRLDSGRGPSRNSRPSREDSPRAEPSREKNRRKTARPSLSVQALPFAALFLFALGVFFTIHNQAGSFDWAKRDAIASEKDLGSEYNLALYAGIGPAAERAGEEGDIPLDLTETFAWQNYSVKKGDSVSKIAAAFSVSMDAIIASNGIDNARSLREGERLRIPNMDGIPYTIKGGDSLIGISQAMGVPLEAILDANDVQSDAINVGKTLFIPGARMKREDLKLALGELFVYPLKGARLSSPFGWRNDPISGVRRHHSAMDLSAPLGTPIKAAMDGKVSSVGYNGTYGNFIILSHSGGYQSLYAHLHTVSVKAGAQVRQDSQIGTVGSTGYSTGPHLHFAVFKNNRAVNPLDLLSPRN